MSRRREPQVARLPRRGPEAPAIYLQAARSPLQEGEQKEERERVRRPGRDPRKQAGQHVEPEQAFEVGQRVGRERDEPFGQADLVGPDRGRQGAGVGDLSYPREEEHAAEHDPRDEHGVGARNCLTDSRNPLLAFIHQNGYSTAR
jgi:hypothetical protein